MITSAQLLPVSKARRLDKIKVRHPQYRRLANSKLKPVVAFDTESDTETGDMFLIACSDGKYLDHPNITFKSVCQFLLRYERYWVFFYNLGWDADLIIKLLPPDILKEQLMDELRFTHEGYTIHYIPKKKLAIKKGKHYVDCYDIAQYYDNKGLAAAYEENIGKLSTDYLEMKDKRQYFRLWEYLRNKKRIRRYCLDDCLLTKELAEHWIDIFAKQFGFYPRNWISSGYLAEKVLLNNHIPVPLFSDVPEQVQELAWKSFYGGRFELIKKGFIGDCWLYDINSAYPYALTKFPDVTKGKWVQSDKLQPKAEIGFFKIEVEITDVTVLIAPFPFRTTQNLIYPIDRFQTYVTLEELKAVGIDSRIKYKILESWQFIPDKNCTYPFKSFIETQYNKRLELKAQKNPLQQAIKIILNSMYGKFAQTRPYAGNLFNPAIASFITGYTRAQLYRFVKEHELERYVVAFATDSIACQKEIPNLHSLALGAFKFENHASDVRYFSNGYYCFNGVWKQRGIGYDKTKNVQVEHIGTEIRQDGHLYIRVKSKKTTHIKNGIKSNQIEKVGVIDNDYWKKIDINIDRKRYFLEDLTSVNNKQMVTSFPLNFSSMPASLIDKLTVNNRQEAWLEERLEQEYFPLSEL